MSRSGIVVSFLVSLAGIGGCATQAETVGAATGAAVGAAVGGGSTVGTIGGATERAKPTISVRTASERIEPCRGARRGRTWDFLSV